MKSRASSVALCLSVGLAAHVQSATTVNCTASAGGIAFGIYNPLRAVANASTGSLRVT